MYGIFAFLGSVKLSNFILEEQFSSLIFASVIQYCLWLIKCPLFVVLKVSDVFCAALQQIGWSLSQGIKARLHVMH